MAPGSLALAALAIAAVVHVAAAQVTHGCVESATASGAKGFFTLNGTCYAGLSIEEGSQGTCNQACSKGGLVCGPASPGTESDCEALMLAYASSPGAPADLPANPKVVTDGTTLCHLVRLSGTGWQLGLTAAAAPWNSALGCDTGISSSRGLAAMVCECGEDVTAPTLTGVTPAQTSTSTVTVTGTTDEPGTVYCAVSSGLPPNSSDVKSSGQSTAVGNAGSFSVTITGVSGEEQKSAYCVGEDAAGNLGGTPAQSAAFDFDLTGPALSNVAATGNSSGVVNAAGSSDEAGTVNCTVDTPGQRKSASSISGGSATLASAGAFTAMITGAHQNTDQVVYCVGQDSVGNYGAGVETPLNQPPTDIVLSGDTVAENSADGTDIGTLTPTDLDAGDTFTFTIESQAVTDAFKISGDKLQVGSGTVDFEATTSISITVRATDSGSLTVDKAFTITVTDVNEAPTRVTVTGDTFARKSDEGTNVGTLAATDPDAGDTTFTFSIESQTVTDAFKISGDKLQVGPAGPGLAKDTVVSVTVVATDAGGLSVSHSVDVTVTEDSANLATLGIITAGLVVVAGFAFAFYKHGAPGAEQGVDAV